MRLVAQANLLQAAGAYLNLDLVDRVVVLMADQQPI
jgi:hypothetical protein